MIEVVAKAHKLTARQQDVLRVIDHYIKQYGAPPTRAEIAKMLGFRSVNAAEDHLKALAKKGVIRLNAGTSRGIKMLHQTSARGLPLLGHPSQHEPLFDPKNVESYLNLDPNLFKSPPLFFWRMTDNQLYPKYMIRDIVAISENIPKKNGQFAFILLKGHYLVRQLFFPTNHQVEIRSIYPNTIRTLLPINSPDFKRLGEVVGLIRPQAL